MPEGGTERGNVVVVVSPEGKLLRVTVGAAEVLDSCALMFITILLLGNSTKELGVTDSERAAGFGPGPPEEDPPPHETATRERDTQFALKK